MPITRDEILDAARTLPESDRKAIVTGLMETLSGDPSGLPDDGDLYAELERRSADSDGWVDWPNLRNELRLAYPA